MIFREANLKDYLILFGSRLPIILIVVGAYNFALFSYDSHVAWVDMYLYNPIVMFVATMPITPAGLGTGQWLTVEFFKTRIWSPLVMESKLTAANLLFTSNLLWFIANQVFKALFGVFCLSQTQNMSIKEYMKDSEEQSV